MLSLPVPDVQVQTRKGVTVAYFAIKSIKKRSVHKEL